MATDDSTYGDGRTQPNQPEDFTRAEIPPADGRPVPQVGRYELLELLGRGGMGHVFRARDLELDRIVAIKVLPIDPFQDELQNRRFQTEARAIARLRHPNIISILDYSAEGSQRYFTMPFIDGGNFAASLPKLRRDLPTGLRLLEQITLAVHHAHRRRVVHRDLKPANILISKAGTPLVTDFGVARLLDAHSDLTQQGMVLGTPAYMAPEQGRGQIHLICPATDIWALGVILFELVTGRKPYLGHTQAEIVPHLLTDDDPPQVRDFVPDVDPGLNAIICKCLKKRIADRYSSASDLAEDLARLRKGAPVRAALPPAPRLSRARRLGLLAGIVLLLGLVGGSFWLTRLPAEPLARICTELDGEDQVQLLQINGRPRWHQTFGLGVEFVGAGGDEPELRVQSADAGLLELIRDASGERLFLTVEARLIRRLDSESPSFGIYMGRTDWPSEPGRVHAMTLLQSDDRSKVRFGIVFLASDGRRLYNSPSNQIDSLASATEWQLFRIRVDPIRIDAEHGDSTLNGGSRIELASELAKAVSNRSIDVRQARPGFEVKNGAGIFVNHCEVAFRRVVISRATP